MKRHKSTVLAALLVLFLMGTTARAQGVTLPQEYKLEVGEYLRTLLQARGPQDGGARGAAPADPGSINLRVRQNLQQLQLSIGGAWWTNTALVQQLGLTDDQKAKIERAYERSRQSIALSTRLLDLEETQLGKLLEGDPIDRNAVLTQIDRVVQARGEMERVSSAMTLEMRESLTLAQWMQLQAAPLLLPRGQKFYWATPGIFSGQRGAAPTPSPSAPGQRRGPGQQ